MSWEDPRVTAILRLLDQLLVSPDDPTVRTLIRLHLEWLAGHTEITS